jgi:hypothetical protein
MREIPKRRDGTLMLLLIFAAGVLQVLGIVQVVAQPASQHDVEWARAAEQIRAIDNRLASIEAKDLRGRMSVVESEINRMKQDRDFDRRMLIAIFGGLFGLLAKAGWDIRISTKRTQEAMR